MKKSVRRFISVFLAVCMVLLCGAQAFADAGGSSADLVLEDLDPSSLGVRKLGLVQDTKQAEQEEIFSLEDAVRVSIFLEDEPAADAGFSAKSIASNASAVSYREALKRRQAGVTAAIEQSLGKKLDVRWNLTLFVNAVSAVVRYGDINRIKHVPGVKDVQIENQYLPQDAQAQPQTANTSSLMVGASQAWSAGYTGAGTRLAIIDTGLDTSHQSFSADAFNYSIGKLSYAPKLMTSSDVSSLQGQLNGKGKYVSAKIPFAYNYVDGNTTSLDHSDGKGNHGSHVAGIAAANRYIKSGTGYVEAAASVHAVGMAPDAQLIVMKVFGSAGGAYDSDYMAALEDAVVLGCDAANLSLGSSVQGFTFANSYQSVMNKLAQAGNPDMLVSISAGNSYGITQFLETDLYIDDVSMHTGGSPGTYVNSLGVASADNIGATGAPMIFNGSQTVYFGEAGDAANASPLSSLSGSYSYVYVGHIGDKESLTAVNSAVSLSGKVVIVDRGSINFSEKAANAASFSPKAILIANNESGALGASVSGYTGTVPVGTISLEDAVIIRGSSKAGTAGNYSYYTGTVQLTGTVSHGQISSREDAKVSSFSSWGVPGSLLLKPEITAPGGDIYSVSGYSTASDENVKDHTSYVSYSGTSMAAPHITGLTGVLAEYLDRNDISLKNNGLTSKYSRRAIMQSLLMSTATPMKNGGQYVSLLQQGAGLAEVSKAIGAYSVVMMDENGSTLTARTGAAADGKVKAELGDDPQRNGIYSYSFTVYNTSGRDLEFSLSTDLFTQASYTEGGSVFMDQGTTALDAAVSYAWDGSAASADHDVDKDGDTDTDDVQAVLDHLVGTDGTDKYPAGLDLDAAETDGRSGISSRDAYMLLSELENSSEKNGLVAAGSSRSVTVTVRLTDAQKRALEEVYTSGAYIEGFTYISCGTKDAEGKDYTHQHSIPVLGFYGSWTDPSMFDNTSYTDGVFGTAKTPYTGHSDTNYLTVRYNGTLNKFSGNPYMAEDTFPAERLAISSSSAMGSIYYNLIRSAGTTGFAVSKLQRAGGDVAEVLAANISGSSVDGIWYDQVSGSWQNLGTKSYSINKTPAAYGLSEGDVFRIGFYAVPEYNAMTVSNDYSSESAGILSLAGFKTLLGSNVLGKGAFVGYDFTVDDTEPRIISAQLSSGNLTISAADDRSLAYVAVLSLDGNTVYSRTAPGTAAYSATVDISSAVSGANGYVAVFAADYAGNEVAKAVKVNNNASEDPYAASSISIIPSSLDLYKGNTADLTVKVMPLTASDRTVSWTSSNSSVATVDESGCVTAVAAGSAVITAVSNSDSSVKASCSVKVTSVSKALNGIVWDEEGGVYFSSFNTSGLPSWTRSHSDAKTEQLASAFMYNASSLYAATLDTSAQESVIYSVDRSSYKMTEYGTNYVFATDMAVGPSGSNAQKYLGLVYTFGSYLAAGPLAPEDDGEGGTYCGLPYAAKDFSSTTGDAYFAGIACRSRSANSSSYYVLDENGVIWQCTLSFSSYGGGSFGSLTKVVETGIGTSFLYQNLYYDGTYLYWSHTDGDIAELIIINPSTRAVYHAGNFGQSVWPVGGLYVSGSVAPASAGDEPAAEGSAKTSSASEPAALNAPVISRSELMSGSVADRFEKEAAKFAKNASKAGPGPAAENFRARSKAVTAEAGGSGSREGSSLVEVRYTEAADAQNGILELSYDPEKLTYKGLGNEGAGSFYAQNASAPGTVKLSYALDEAVPAGQTIFTFEFESGCSEAEIILRTLEKNETLNINDETTAVEVPSGHELEHHEAVSAGCTAAGNTEYWVCTHCGRFFADAQGRTEIEEGSWVTEALGHLWKDPVWNWTGFSAAFAVFTCSRDEAHTETVEAVITSVRTDPSPTENGSIVYTAAAVGPDGNTYTNTRTEILPATGYTYRQPVYTWTQTEDGWSVTALKECIEDAAQNISETVTAAYAVTKAPSCEAEGEGTYTAVFEYSGFETQTKTVAVPAAGHDWHFSGFDWQSDEEGAVVTGVKAVFSCSSCGKLCDAAAIQSYSDFAVTASVLAQDSPDGNAHSQTRPAVQLDGVSLELAKKISVRFKLQVPDFADHAEVYFEADKDADGGAYSEKRISVDLDKSTSRYYSASAGKFIIDFPEITSKEMMDHVRLVVFDRSGEPMDIYRVTKKTLYLDKIDYCAADWCNDAIAALGADKSNEISYLAMAVLNYGSESQKHFKYNEDKPADPNRYLAEDMAAVTKNSAYDMYMSDSNAKDKGYSGITLDLAADTRLRVKFKENVPVRLNGKSASLAYESSSGKYVLDITGLRCMDLDEQFTVAFTGTDGSEITLGMCALSWSNLVMDAKAEEFVPLAKAVYLYSRAAENYFD